MKETKQKMVWILIGMVVASVLSVAILLIIFFSSIEILLPESTPIPDQVIATNDVYLQPYVEEKQEAPVVEGSWDKWQASWLFYKVGGESLGTLDFSGLPYDEHLTDTGYRVQVTSVESTYLLVVVTNLNTGEMYADGLIYQDWDNSFVGGIFQGYRIDE